MDFFRTQPYEFPETGKKSQSSGVFSGRFLDCFAKFGISKMPKPWRMRTSDLVGKISKAGLCYHHLNDNGIYPSIIPGFSHISNHCYPIGRHGMADPSRPIVSRAGFPAQVTPVRPVGLQKVCVVTGKNSITGA